MEEVNRVGIPAGDAQLKKISAPTVGVTDAPVSNIKLGPEVEVAVSTVAELLGESDGITLLRECYRQEKRSVLRLHGYLPGCLVTGASSCWTHLIRN